MQVNVRGVDTMNPPNVVLALGRAASQPTYVYDLAVLRRQIDHFESIPWTSKRLFFATMANDHPRVIAQIRDKGHGLFVNSIKHLQLARSLGFESKRIVYAASNMTLEEMRFCRNEGVHLVIDALDQIEMLRGIGSGGESIGLRVNVGSALNGKELRFEPGYRFGVLPEELNQAVAIARRAGVKISGVHSYFGTGLMDWSILVDGLARLGEVATVLPDLEYIDGGGGFGVSDELDEVRFDLNAYGKNVAEVLNTQERRLRRKLSLYVEPGRFLAANCGWFFVKVVSRKPRGDRLFVGVNASVSQFPRMLLHPDLARHPWQVVGREDACLHELDVWISGNSTYSRDFLARGTRAPAPNIGDTIVFHNAGAYCRSMLSDFLGKERPSEIVIDTAALVPESNLRAAVSIGED